MNVQALYERRRRRRAAERQRLRRRALLLGPIRAVLPLVVACLALDGAVNLLAALPLFEDGSTLTEKSGVVLVATVWVVSCLVHGVLVGAFLRQRQAWRRNVVEGRGVYAECSPIRGEGVVIGDRGFFYMARSFWGIRHVRLSEEWPAKVFVERDGGRWRLGVGYPTSRLENHDCRDFSRPRAGWMPISHERLPEVLAGLDELRRTVWRCPVLCCARGLVGRRFAVSWREAMDDAREEVRRLRRPAVAIPAVRIQPRRRLVGHRTLTLDRSPRA